MRFKFIDAEKVTYPVTVLCRVMNVSRGGDYAWSTRKASAHSKRDAVLLEKIRMFHDISHQRYGSPRIYDDLRGAREAVSKRRVERLMRQDGLVGKTRRKFKPQTTDSNHGLNVARNLLKQDFKPAAPDRVWVSDITQVHIPGGWLYLAVVLDLFARKVVGWEMRTDMTTPLVLDAVRMAIAARKPPPGLIFHSDRGSQYAATDTETLLRAHGMSPSMSGVGCCYDNAVAESFFSGLKSEVGDTFPSSSQGQSEVFLYIEPYYNRTRRHRFNGNVSPVDCEAFFARNGHRPSCVLDLVAETSAVHSETNALGTTLSSRGSARTPTSIAAVPHQRPVVGSIPPM